MKKIIDIKRQVREGEMLPKYYGVAYLEMDMLIAIAYPIPLNIVVGVWRRFWNWLKAPESLFKDGYRKGYTSGYSDGRNYAFNQYKDQVKTQYIEKTINRFLDEYEKAIKLPKEKQEGWIWRFIDSEKKRITL